MGGQGFGVARRWCAVPRALCRDPAPFFSTATYFLCTGCTRRPLRRRAAVGGRWSKSLRGHIIWRAVPTGRGAYAQWVGITERREWCVHGVSSSKGLLVMRVALVHARNRRENAP